MSELTLPFNFPSNLNVKLLLVQDQENDSLLKQINHLTLIGFHKKAENTDPVPYFNHEKILYLVNEENVIVAKFNYVMAQRYDVNFVPVPNSKFGNIISLCVHPDHRTKSYA